MSFNLGYHGVKYEKCEKNFQEGFGYMCGQIRTV